MVDLEEWKRIITYMSDSELFELEEIVDEEISKRVGGDIVDEKDKE